MKMKLLKDILDNKDNDITKQELFMVKVYIEGLENKIRYLEHDNESKKLLISEMCDKLNRYTETDLGSLYDEVDKILKRDFNFISSFNGTYTKHITIEENVLIETLIRCLYVKLNDFNDKLTKEFKEHLNKCMV